MARCPQCNTALKEVLTPFGVTFDCPKCGGQNVALAVLRNLGTPQKFLNAVWLASGVDGIAGARRCPHCTHPMVSVTVAEGAKRLTLDVCRGCHAAWFDRGELAAVPRKPAPAPPPAPLPQPLREKMALFELQQKRQAEVDAISEGPPTEVWHWAPGVMGLPVEVVEPERRTWPVVTWGVIGLCAAALLLAHPLADVIKEWGLVPAQWAREGGLTLVTSFFLHAGWFHLLSNMYFLAIFGDNVEDSLGVGLFAVLLLAAHLAGLVLHGATDPHSNLPLVGASAGISGVLGYYAVMFPRARLGLMVYFRWIQMPAYMALVLFGGLQLLGTMVQASGFSHVSYAGHLGGLAVGIACAVAVRTTGGNAERERRR